MSGNLEDDIECAQLDGVVGIDSANPLILATDDRHLFFEGYMHLGGRLKELYWQFTGVPEDRKELMFANVSNMRRVINGRAPELRYTPTADDV